MRKTIKVLIIAMLFMTGCGHEADHTHGDAEQASASQHNDNIEPESYTLYTENLELFVEFDPIVVGETSAFIVHLTLLNDDYAPLNKADVRLSLEIDGEDTQLAEGHSGIPGIYHFDLSPNIYGNADIVLDINKGEFNDQFVLEHVHIYKERAGIHQHSQEASSGQIFYSKEQAWSNDFDVAAVSLQDFSKLINASGEIMAMPGEKQNLIAKIDGMVMFSTRNLVQGSPVKKGDLLFMISSKGFANNNITVKYQEAMLSFEKSKNQYLRHKNLVEEKIVSQSQFIESRNRYLADSVVYYNLKQNVSDDGVKVYAPLTGYIHELIVSEGQFASTGSLLATISSNKVMLLRADVSQQYFGLLDQISDATFRPAYSKKVYTIAELNGKLLSKASSVAENNHYMPVFFEVINDGTLLEGAFAEFYLKTLPRPGKLVIPVNALIEEQDNFYVYVQVAGETFQKKQVQPGYSDGIYTELISGLEAGERIVTRGAMLIKAASVSTAPVHAHSH